MTFYRRPKPDFKAILTNQKAGNRGSASEQTRKWLQTWPRINKCRNMEKTHQLRTSSAEDDEVDIIDLNGNRRGWHKSLPAVGKPLSLPFGGYRVGQRPRLQCLSYFCYKNTSKGQTSEKLQVLLVFRDFVLLSIMVCLLGSLALNQYPDIRTDLDEGSCSQFCPCSTQFSFHRGIFRMLMCHYWGEMIEV